MKKDDIFIWAYLSALLLCVIGFIAYHINNFIKRRRETKEEKEIREAKELEKYKKQQERYNRFFGSIISLIGFFLMLSAAAIFLYQIYHWLKHGQWLEIPFSDVLSKLDLSVSEGSRFEWKGVAKIFIWIANQSSVLVMAMLGFIIVIIGNVTSELS